MRNTGRENAVKNATHKSDMKSAKTRHAAEDARASGKNPVRVADVKQRHATNSGHSGKVIKSLFG
jgi:hypothetical protein